MSSLRTRTVSVKVALYVTCHYTVPCVTRRCTSPCNADVLSPSFATKLGEWLEVNISKFYNVFIALEENTAPIQRLL